MNKIIVVAIALISAFVTCPFSATAQEVNALDFLNKQLSEAPYVTVEYEKEYKERVCFYSVPADPKTKAEDGYSPVLPLIQGEGPSPRERCHWETRRRIERATVPASAATADIVLVRDIKFDESRMVSEPKLALVARKTLFNCADANVSSSITLGVSGTSSWSVSKSSGVSTTVGGSVGVSASFFGLVSSNEAVNFSQTVSVSTTVQEGHQEGTTRSTTDTISIGPRHVVDIELLAYQAKGAVPFSGYIILDGTVAPNVSGVGKVSDIVPEAKRTVPLTGVLTIAEVSSGELRTTDLGLAGNCAEFAPGSAVTNSFTIEESPQWSFLAKSLGSYFTSGFGKHSKLKRNDDGLLPQLHPFTKPAAGTSVTQSVIGPPNGTYYEILYVTEVYQPAVSCGLNDLGIPILGVFSREARQYRTYVDGKLISEEQRFVDTFVRCHEA